MSRPDGREPKACPLCGETCTYDGWDHVHRSGLGIGSCRPAAPAAGADLREQIAEAVQLALINPDATYQEIADELLAGPLRPLVEQAAEAREWHEAAWDVMDEHTTACAERDALAAEAARLRAAIERRAAAWEKQASSWRALLARDGRGYVVARELRALLDGDS